MTAEAKVLGGVAGVFAKAGITEIPKLTNTVAFTPDEAADAIGDLKYGTQLIEQNIAREALLEQCAVIAKQLVEDQKQAKQTQRA
jgi:hypothetical protein